MIVKPGELTGNIRREADVAIIGSGAGGGPIAKELAEAGYSVVVLEEGGYFTREDFDFRPGQAFMRLYRDAGQTATVGLPVIIVPQGKTVGGTTTVNSGTCLRVPRHVLKRWHLECGLRDLEEDELNLLYAALEEYLFVKRADPEVVGENNLLFLRTAEKLGYSGGFLPRNAKDCEGYGVCAYGCPSGAKQSVDVSFIPDAVRAGADVYTRCRVERIVVRGEGDRGARPFPRSAQRTEDLPHGGGRPGGGPGRRGLPDPLPAPAQPYMPVLRQGGGEPVHPSLRRNHGPHGRAVGKPQGHTPERLRR